MRFKPGQAKETPTSEFKQKILKWFCRDSTAEPSQIEFLPFLSHDFSLWLFQAIPTGIKSHEIPISSSTQKTDAKKIYFWSLWCLSGAGCLGDIGSLYHLIITTKKVFISRDIKNDLVFFSCDLWWLCRCRSFRNSNALTAPPAYDSVPYTIFNLQFICDNPAEVTFMCK